MGIHLMHDIETMGDQPNAAVISIGAVKFTLDGKILDTFYKEISIESCERFGLSTSAGTIRWWLKQSDAARNIFTRPGLDLDRVLVEYNEFIGNPDAYDGIWGNGSDFDNVIMVQAYKACGWHAPWKFWQHRCFRTLKALNKHITIERQGTHHNALDDALHQTRHLFAILGVQEISTPAGADAQVA